MLQHQRRDRKDCSDMTTTRYYTASLWKTKDLILMIFGILAIGIFLGVALSCFVVISTAEAEDVSYDCWVICQPNDYVNIRSGPGNRKEIVGYAGCGMRFRTDGRERNGYIHLVDVGNETGEGWIHEGYIVYCEPRPVDREMEITGTGRVACRKTVDGKRRCWARPGDTVTVYWMTGEWAVTSKGYIQSRFLRGE